VKDINDKDELSAKDFWGNFDIKKAIHIIEEVWAEVS
jgi:hypothetical protein